MKTVLFCSTDCAMCKCLCAKNLPFHIALLHIAAGPCTFVHNAVQPLAHYPGTLQLNRAFNEQPPCFERGYNWEPKIAKKPPLL